MDWLSSLKSQSVSAVAEAAGLKLTTRGSVRGITPCPACKLEAVSTSQGDRRAPIGLTSGGEGWRCHRCDASGDSIALAALIVTGTTKPQSAQWEAVRAFAAAQGWCSPDSKAAPWKRSKRRKTRHKVSGRDLTQAPPPPDFKRPPPQEVAAVWEASKPIYSDATVRDYLLQRMPYVPTSATDAYEVTQAARALPVDLTTPGWAAAKGVSWARSGHRLLVRLWGPEGRLESLHVRAIVDHKTKTLLPTGFHASGLIMADLPMQRVLRDGPSGPPVDLVVAEGIVDWLTWATRAYVKSGPNWGVRSGTWHESLHTVAAVAGVFSGSWTQAIADRIPNASRVVVRTHDDDAGNKYADRVVKSLQDRCSVMRGNDD